MSAQVCHIRAVAPRGPRHDLTQSDDERRTLANLIALCYEHHREVDSNPNIFNAELLEELRAEHEEEVDFRLSSPNANEGIDSAINSDPLDFEIVRVSNYSEHPLSRDHWKTDVGARVGDIIGVAIYYHVSGSLPAYDVQLYLEHLGDATCVRHHFLGYVAGANVPKVRGAASVRLDAPINLEYVPGSMSWYPEQQTHKASKLPDHQNEQALFEPEGLLLGNVAPGWRGQGSIVCNFFASPRPTNSSASP